MLKFTRRWTPDDMIKLCITHSWCTYMDCKQYEEMLDFVHEHKPTNGNIEKVAAMISAGSNHFDSTTAEFTTLVAWKIANEVVITCVSIEEQKKRSACTGRHCTR